MPRVPPWTPDRWRDLPQNPLVSPPQGEEPGSVIGDPQVVPPWEHDGRWHMYATGRGVLYHFVSDDGVRWEVAEALRWRAATCFLLRWRGDWYMYYALIRESEPRTVIVVRRSRNLREWSEPVEVLRPELPWELEGPLAEARNPCAVPVGGELWLYYSAGTVLLEDAGYEEPKYVSVAFSSDPMGPFERLGGPLLRPDPRDRHRNLGAGALKVYRYRGEYLGFNNGIYLDGEGRSRSAILLMASDDGLEWEDAPFNPIIHPTSGWKRALVYQLDVVFEPQPDGTCRVLLYYNARDGWRGGVERIGCSVLEGAECP